MQADSKPVTSNQRHIHPKLPTLVKRYLTHPYRTPVADHSRHAFKQLEAQLKQTPAPLVLDSFCGTGQSTAILAKRYPGHLVVGIDQSAHRLAKHPRDTGHNYLFLQAQCEDIWQLMLENGLSPDYHYLLYPNPWPKSGHIQRRIHGGPAFRNLLALGGHVELRSNWQIYVEEFGVALHLGGHYGSVQKVTPDEPLTLFEQKYQNSGHSLWSYTGTIHRTGTEH